MKSDDPNSLFTAIASVLLSNELARLTGPYMLIVVMAAMGALAALGRQGPERRPTGLTFVAVVVSAAVAFTSLLARVAVAYFPDEWGVSPLTLFAPISFVIGLVGLDWDKVIPWVWNRYREWRTGGRLAEGDKNA